MGRPATGRPSDMELAILKVLWDLRASTVNVGQDVLARERPIGYTTVLKMLQIMRDKGLVRCDSRKEPHVFRHRQQPRIILRKLAGDLLERAFDGSAAPEACFCMRLAHKQAIARRRLQRSARLD